MATANVRNILRLRGWLVIDPTDLNAAFPHGGTPLGLTRDAEFQLKLKTSDVTAEEWGGATTEVVYVGEAGILACVLREFDNDALARFFPNTADGSVSTPAKKVVSGLVTSGNRPGYLLSNKSAKLLFSPRAVDKHPMILIYKAIPLVEESAMLQLSMGEEVGVAVAFKVAPDSQGRLYRIGSREDLAGLL